MTPEERRRRLEEIAARVVDRLDREWPAADAHINELEDRATGEWSHGLVVRSLESQRVVFETYIKY